MKYLLMLTISLSSYCNWVSICIIDGKESVVRDWRYESGNLVSDEAGSVPSSSDMYIMGDKVQCPIIAISK